jgi:uncharacterized protein YegP (UPF0339 family)
MSARQPRFEIVRTDSGWHARFRAANGRVVLSSEVYTRAENARGGLAVLFGVCRCAYMDAPVVELDEREARP